MRRRAWMTVPACVAVLAVVGGACAAPPTPTQWKIKPVSITVHNGEDNDGGDEPYIIQMGFRTKIGVPGSAATSVSSQCYRNRVPASNAAPDGTTVLVPPGSADVTFDGVQNLEISDLANGDVPFELLGTFTFVMERDGIFGGCAVSDLIRDGLLRTVREALELSIASSPLPPTTEQVVDLVVTSIRGFLYAVGNLIGAVLEGLGNPDDVIGVAAQIHLPTRGVLTDLINTALDVAGLFSPGLENGFIPVEDLPSSFLIRVGTLSPSRAEFRLPTPGYADYSYVSQVSR